MPATRVTIASNANQSVRAPLLLRTSDKTTPEALRKQVFDAAKSKLRVKKPTRIFLHRTGDELLSEADWQSHLKDDITLLVSVGEDYVGVLRQAEGTHGEKNGVLGREDVHPQCSVCLLAEKAYVEDLAVAQLETTAHTLPGIVHAVGQPDLHPGNKFPIGAVFASSKWIHPPLIGGDIGCGMAWYKTQLSRDQVDGNKGKKIAGKLRGLEGPWRTSDEREAWLKDDHGSCSAGEEWDKSVGTIGAGNHFAEIQIVEEVKGEGNEFGLRQNDVVLLVHSGSRGYGGSILKRFTSESQCFSEDSVEARDYLIEHDKACRWARTNRDLIALRFLSCLEPGEPTWALGSNEEDSVEYIEAIMRAKAKLRERRVVDIWHNNVERVKWPPLPPKTASTLLDKLSDLKVDDTAPQEHVYIHRKGAAPTYDPATNTPLTILPLPGSRATPTMILKPTFSEATSWGRLNALSLAHGAGRAMSRAKALSSLSQKYKNHNLLEPTGGNEGTWVICDEKDLVYEEAPDAYKDVRAVAEDLEREGVAEVVGWCRARVSYKIRNEAR